MKTGVIIIIFSSISFSVQLFQEKLKSENANN